MSALSTIAFKDGHKGNSVHRSTPSTNTLEAERADRISRLAGLERVSTARQGQNPNITSAAGGQGQIPGYFDQNGNPVYTTRMVSTVGSASATGSAGGRTTWASGTASQRGGDEESEMGRDGDTETEGDGMSVDANFRDMDERDRYSVGASAMDEDQDDGMSDNTSLVGFGEGAGSTMSGPTYSRKEALGRSVLAREGSASGGAFGASTGTERGVGGGTETAERIVRERLDDGAAAERRAPLGSPDEAGLGKFYFEEKK